MITGDATTGYTTKLPQTTASSPTAMAKQRVEPILSYLCPQRSFPGIVFNSPGLHQRAWCSRIRLRRCWM